MRIKLLLLAAFTFGCGTKAPLVQDAQDAGQDVLDYVGPRLDAGLDWIFDRLNVATSWTTEELHNCFSGGCDLRESLKGEDGKDGSDGTNGTAGTDGNDGDKGDAGVNGSDGNAGSDGLDGASCTVAEVSNGAVIQCGDDLAVIYNGEDGEDGDNGEDGRNGTNGRNGSQGDDGESCYLERSNLTCRGDNLKYDLYVICGEESARLGKFTEVDGCDD